MVENRRHGKCFFDVKLERLSSQDIGRVVGTAGLTLQAIRHVLKASAGKNGKGCELRCLQFDTVIDPEKRKQETEAKKEQSSVPGVVRIETVAPPAKAPKPFVPAQVISRPNTQT